MLIVKYGKEKIFRFARTSFILTVPMFHLSYKKNVNKRKLMVLLITVSLTICGFYTML